MRFLSPWAVPLPLPSAATRTQVIPTSLHTLDSLRGEYVSLRGKLLVAPTSLDVRRAEQLVLRLRSWTLVAEAEDLTRLVAQARIRIARAQATAPAARRVLPVPLCSSPYGRCTVLDRADFAGGLPPQPIAQIANGTPVTVLEERVGFFGNRLARVAYAGGTGWVFAADVRRS